MTTHYAVVDLGYGDSGKGILTARLTKALGATWVVRTSGGCQAAHNVITDDGRHHTFAQFGAGTFDGAQTFLSKYMLVEPFSLIIEAGVLETKGIKDPLSLMYISTDALITTPYHWVANQWEEDQRNIWKRHGSTGRGIGMTTLFALEHPNDAPRAWHLWMDEHNRPRLEVLREWCLQRGVPDKLLPSVDEVVARYASLPQALFDRTTDDDEWAANLGAEDVVIFEGAQGVLLDQDHGFHPHTTWTRTTDANVHALIDDLHHAGYPIFEDLKVIGVVRSYMTRHGAGPFVTEERRLTVDDERHNAWGQYEGHWRKGYADLVALRYAIECCQQVDGLYVTHLDQAKPEFKAAIAYKDADGNPLKLEHYPAMARAERQSQTEALSTAKPVLVPLDFWDVGESLSDALDLPLYGKGWGPKISEGVLGLG